MPSLLLPLLLGIWGPGIWDTKVTHFFHVPSLAKYIPYDLGLNDAFMVFGAISLAGNIVGR